MVRPIWASAVFTSGASPCTTTFSLVAPTCSTASTRTRAATSITTPLWMKDRKPGDLASILYLPTGRNWIRYCPDRSVVAVRVKLVSRLVAVTTTFGITALVVSVTVPETDVVVTWAVKQRAARKRMDT